MSVHLRWEARVQASRSFHDGKHLLDSLCVWYEGDPTDEEAIALVYEAMEQQVILGDVLAEWTFDAHAVDDVEVDMDEAYAEVRL